MTESKRIKERQTWRNLKDGNKAAFQKIYFEHYRFLYNYCRKYTNNVALVEDLLQELFITIFEKKERLSDTNNIRLYLFCSIRRTLFRTLNSRELKITDSFDFSHPEFHFDEGVEPDYGDDEEQNRLRKLLFNSINTLGERQKEMIYLKYFSGLGSKEIADVLGVSYQTVRNTLCNALQKIRKDFDNEIPKGRMVLLFQYFFSEKI